MEQLIKSVKRVKQYAEVLTPKQTVSDMLDLVPDCFDTVNKTFFEPACGTGNFLVQILERKLRLVDTGYYDRDVFYAISSIYGVDIQDDNVLETRERLLEIIEADYFRVKGYKTSVEFSRVIAEVLENNIILGNTLTDRMLKLSNSGVATGDISSDRIYFYEWSLKDDRVSKTFITKIPHYLFDDDDDMLYPDEAILPDTSMKHFEALFGGL